MTSPQLAAPVTDNPLGWIVAEALKIPHTRHAILVSTDGLLRARSAGISQGDAETMAAALTGIRSLARKASLFCDGELSGWRQCLVEYDGGYVVVTGGGENSFLAASAGKQVDLQDLSYRMQSLSARLGQVLSTPQRDVRAGRA